MALPELLRALREQAAERRAAVLSAAEESARRIRDESGRRLSRRRGEFLARVRAEEEDAAHRALSHARSEAMRAMLTARGHLLVRVRDAVEERIHSADDDPSYLEALPAHVLNALGRLPKGGVRLGAPATLVPRIERAVEGCGDVSVEVVPDLGPGFRALSRAGDMEVDGTLETWLEHRWPRLAVAILTEVSS